MDNTNIETAKLLNAIELDEGRWWKVELDRLDDRVNANPIKVSLMETTVEGKLKLSIAIGYTRTIADPVQVLKAANEVLTMVGGYRRVVGRYPEEAS